MHRFYPSVQQQTKLKTIQQQPFKLEQDLYQRGSNNPYAEQLKLYKDRVIHPCWTFECKPFAKTTEHERKILINKDNDLARLSRPNSMLSDVSKDEKRHTSTSH